MKNEILDKEILEMYDHVEVRKTILGIFKLFNYLEITNDKAEVPKITNTYQVRYEQIVPTKKSTVENFVLRKEIIEMRCEDKRKQLFSKIVKALKKLNELELKVFYHAFYENQKDEDISKIVYYGYKKVHKIRKSACIKFLSSLGLDSQCLKREESLERSVSLV